MSLAKMKAKENKGKQKTLPKLRTILADPIKKRSPTLTENELETLQSIIHTSVESSGIEKHKYATIKHICLGLESSLRAINNQTSSCVFISLSIRPNHIVSLIARNAEVKDETQPVYAQPHLEEFTEKLFGVRALCMVFPKDLAEISEDLWRWVEQRRRPKTLKLRETKTKSKTKPKTKKAPKVQVNEAGNEQNQNQLEQTEEQKPLEGDFISFNDDNVDISKLQLKEDKNEALDTLSRIMEKVPSTVVKPVEQCVPMEVECVADTEKIEEIEANSEDSVDFLDVYKPLVLHKIKPNPNKKPKKKRNKNKNKNLKK